MVELEWDVYEGWRGMFFEGILKLIFEGLELGFKFTNWLQS
jgi:hypothetical protein